MADRSLFTDGGGGVLESPLVLLCIEAATQSGDAIETWRRQRRTLERLPSQLAETLLHRLLRRRLLFPSLLEVFKYSVEDVDLRGESSVDAEWMAYLGAFHYLHSLNVSNCHKVDSSALWALSGMSYLKEVDLSRCYKVDDSGIKHLQSIQTIETLCISQTSVTTKGITLLSSLKKLSKLGLGGLFITDTALVSLQGLTNLQHLDIWGNDITNVGADILVNFPNLKFLNLSWTNVTVLPNLTSVKILNMSNCIINSLFKGEGIKARLTNLNLSGSSFKDITTLFSYFDSTSLSFLDLSLTALRDLSFLPLMPALEHLDLRSTYIGDDSAEIIASVGANLKFLDFSGTRMSTNGVAILAGHVPKLETLSMAFTSCDDLAISYIALMSSLKAVDMKGACVGGFIQHNGSESEWEPSLKAFESLSQLEKLNLENIPLKDEAISVLLNFKELKHLFLSSSLITDAMLNHFSSIPKLITLGIRDAVVTDVGIDGFNPPRSLRVLDLSGCWLLTKDGILRFLQLHPKIEVKHDNARDLLCESKDTKLSTRRFSSSPLKSDMITIIDQRLKYSRAELLSLQFGSMSVVPPSDLAASPK